MRLSLKWPFFRRKSARPLDAEWLLFRHMVALHISCLALAVLLVLGAAVWGVNYDLEQVRVTLLQTHMQGLRSHGLRSIGTIQKELRANPTGGLEQLRTNEALRRHWNQAVLKDEAWEYAAVVDHSGKIIMHSEPKFEGMQLQPTWYERLVPEAGDDVVFTRDTALSRGVDTYDVGLPIYVDNVVVATLHNSLNARWLENALAAKRRQTLGVWGWILGITAFLLVGAGTLLWKVGRWLTILRERRKLGQARRFTELGRLMAGIVHEIRNPLNAMRLNLHVLATEWGQKQRPSHACDQDSLTVDATQIIQETNEEIERIDRLMRALLRYVHPERLEVERLDVRKELQSTLTFLKPLLEQAEVAVQARFPEAPAFIEMDRDRFRQVMINLIVNAKEATGPAGQIAIVVTRNHDWVEITVSDDGPGIPAADRERVFEPFYSTKDQGTGLGLALVRRCVEEVGGTVTCEANEQRGARFHLGFNEASAPPHHADVSEIKV